MNLLRQFKSVSDKFFLKLLIGSLLCTVAPFFVYGQDSVIVKAMRDELNRNIHELKIKGSEKPFFIGYGVRDEKSWSFQGKWGALQNSQGYHSRYRTITRVLVGDYSFNDESFDDGRGGYYSQVDISLPEDDDYLGIRRSFWLATDAVYHSAASQYLRNVETLKETNKELADVPHKRFAKGEAIKSFQSLLPTRVDTAHWEKLMMQLSGLFIRKAGTRNSSVDIHYSERLDYLVNSEGVTVKQPVQRATFNSTYQTIGKEGEPVSERISFVARTPVQLPSEGELATGIREMIARADAKKNAASLTDVYEGPVLISGQAAANFLFSCLFSGAEGLEANDYVPPLTGININNRMSGLDSKMGKMIMNESITIREHPLLTSFQDTDLLGSFQVDDEGIAPPQELTLVENGILKNLLNNRTLTSSTQKSNGFSGHYGVIEFSSTVKFSEAALKGKLIQIAKEQGLEFALVIRQPSDVFSGNSIVSKVFVSDGHEEIIQNINLRQTSLKALKHLSGVTIDSKAYNLDQQSEAMGEQFMPYSIDFSLGLRGTRPSGVFSMIAPRGILVDQLEIPPSTTVFIKEKEYIPGPWQQE